MFCNLYCRILGDFYFFFGVKIYLRETIITVINSINITKIMKLEDINNIFRFKDVFIRTTIDVPVFKFYKIP